MDKLDDVRQVKVATVEAAARIVAENLSTGSRELPFDVAEV